MAVGFARIEAVDAALVGFGYEVGADITADEAEDETLEKCLDLKNL